MGAKSLYKLAMSSDDGFRRLFDETQDGEFLGYHIPVENEWGRFTVWGRNLGAFQASNSQSSLEHRLRNSDEVKDVVRENLEDVEQACGSAYNIVAGTQRNRTTPINLPKGIVSSTSELDELLSSIQSSITLLFRTSMLLRQYRPRGRITQERPAPDPTLDIRHVKDKFRKVEDRTWLAERLGTLIAERRDYIQYRQEHQLRLAAVHDESAGEVAPGIEVNTIATTYNANEEVPASTSSPKQLEAAASRQTPSVRTQATSFASAFGVDDDEELRVPELTDLVFNKTTLQYNEPFECPFCRTIQSVGNRQDWKKHVYTDLQPFSCTAQGCSSESFSSRHEWARHEIATHRRQWRCPQCPKSVFSQKAHFVQHLISAHPDVPSNSHSLLLDTCHAPVLYFDQSACPLCREWQPPANLENNSLDFYRHLGQHMMLLSLSAIPQVIEGLELVERPSADDKTSTRSQVSAGSDSMNASPVFKFEIAPSLNPIRPFIEDRTDIVDKSHKTWFLAPSWQFAPGGRIALGNVIPDVLRPQSPLKRVQPIPQEYITITVKQDLRFDDKLLELKSSSLGSLWAQFLKTADVIPGFKESEHKTDTESTYKIDAMEEHVLSVEALAKHAILDAVLTSHMVETLRAGLPMKPVFLVSGVMIAKNFSFTLESSRLCRGRAAEVSVEVPGLPIGLSAGLSVGVSEDFEAASDFVFAYRLTKIVPSDGSMRVVESEKYPNKGAIF